ncbi:MAG TPA: hypothetical protein VKA43_07890 [Gammaproteobacteria bacterium]|nr:hypothetical protein [Gammaproteobacteria bacterium]
MHAYELAIAIVAIVFTYKLIRLAMLRQPTRRDDTANTDLNNRLAEVEERVRVLERIVTDDRHDLRQQFKDLES